MRSSAQLTRFKVRLQLWDTAGQERFRSMVNLRLPCSIFSTETFASQAPMYYRGAHAALLLYDITNASTFEDVKGWLEGMILVLQLLTSS